MRIDSGATTERKIRMTVVTLGALFMAGYFAYDGWVGYPAANQTQLRTLTPPDAAGEVRIDERVTEELRRRTPDELHMMLGEAPMKTSNERRYFGPGGYLTVPLRPDSPVMWYKLQHSSGDMVGQKAIAITLGIVGLFLLFKLRGIFASRVVLDDAGLHPSAVRTITWEQMTALDASRYKDKAWVDLKFYDGRDRQYRLDAYHLAEFKPIVREICGRKGFPSPLPAVETSPDDQNAAT